MKTFYQLLKLTVVITAVVTIIISSSCRRVPEFLNEAPGIIRNDYIRTFRSYEGDVFHNNQIPIKTMSRYINIDWTQISSKDSLAILVYLSRLGHFCDTGRFIIPALNKGAWISLKDISAYLCHKGETVKDVLLTYYGNPLSDIVYHDGVFVVENEKGKYGVVNHLGFRLIEPVWDHISCFSDFLMATSDGEKRLFTYSGIEFQSLGRYDDIKELTYQHDNSPYSDYGANLTYCSGLYAYRYGQKWGLLDLRYRRHFTPPMFDDVTAIDKNTLRAVWRNGDTPTILKFRRLPDKCILTKVDTSTFPSIYTPSIFIEQNHYSF